MVTAGLYASLAESKWVMGAHQLLARLRVHGIPGALGFPAVNLLRVTPELPVINLLLALPKCLILGPALYHIMYMHASDGL